MRRSTPPAVIMGCGLISVVVLGVVVSKMGDVHPIVGLKPALEKAYGQRGFRCWVKIDEQKIEVQPPAELALDELGRRRLGAVALLRYLELAKHNSQVERAVVLPPRESSIEPVEVTRFQAELVGAVLASQEHLVEQASIAAGTSLTVTHVGPGTSGAIVVVEGAPDGPAARRVAKAVLRVPNVSAVRLPLPQGGLVEGTDAALLARPGDVAPVRS